VFLLVAILVAIEKARFRLPARSDKAGSATRESSTLPRRPQAHEPARKLQNKTSPTVAPNTLADSIEMKLVRIPIGTFDMGTPSSDPAANADEMPQHPVRIARPFALGAYEVTQGQYRAVTGAAPSALRGSDDLPVETVSWFDAVAFCNALSRKEGLPPF